MIRMNNDYNHAAHPAVLKVLWESQNTAYPGYGEDSWCEKAAKAISSHLGGIETKIYFFVGGTPANQNLIDAALHPWQSVLSAENGHINAHEGGSIEHIGHKVIALPGKEGKLTATAIRSAMEDYEKSGKAEWLTQPKLVYISSPSEYGTIYSLEELTAIHEVCAKYGLYLFLDGARMAYYLTAPGCDVTLADIARLTDAFYIGGTKCGALMGEAMVLVNPALWAYFRTSMKQNGSILAKGWLLGLQFYTLFKDNLYFALAQKANTQAQRIQKAFLDKDIPLLVNSPTNQQFVIVTNAQAAQLQKKVICEPEGSVDDGHLCLRLCTSWSTTDEEIEAVLEAIRAL